VKPDYKALSIIMDALNQSPKLLRLAWACVSVAFIFALGYLLGNLPWDRM